jgi:hypothetical protein
LVDPTASLHGDGSQGDPSALTVEVTSNGMVRN